MKRTAITGMLVLMTASGCFKVESGGGINSDAQSAAPGVSSPRYTLCIHNGDSAGNPSGSALYCDTSGSSALQLTEGRDYSAVITRLDSGGPYEYRVGIERVDLVSGGASASQVFHEGNNLLRIASPGDYAIRIAPTEGGNVYPSRVFEAGVQCDNPVALNAGGMNASAISVSGGDNLYSYGSSGVVGSGAGGRAPYLCAWDFNGDGSRDSAFSACGSAVSDVYASYVGARNIGLIVKDSCNVSVAVSSSENVPAGGLSGLTPGGGTVYIHGRVTSATGAAAPHPSFGNNGNGANYYATNNAAMSPVHSVLRASGAGSTFTIASDQFRYGSASSVTFGMKIEMAGLNVVLGQDAASTSISAARASIASVEDSSDRVGDGQPSLRVAGSSCSISSQGAEVVEVVGVPCAAGTTNPDMGNREVTYRFRVWARYSCAGLSGPGSTVNMEGDFEGLDDIVDSCVGGGQGQGGGIAPPSF